MKYDYNDREHRFFLAGRILHVLTTAGFVEETDKHVGCKERVFARAVEVKGEGGAMVATPVRILVYTSIDIRDNLVRAVAKDAIRVCGVRTFKDGDKGCIKRKRVHRTGEVAEIEKRLLTRMRTAYMEALTAYRNPTKCHCGALKFISAKGNEVCSELCWTKRPDYRPKPTKRYRNYRRR